MLSARRVTSSRARLVGAWVVSCVLAAGCAPKMPPENLGTATGYDRLEQQVDAQTDFEVTPTELDPADVVPRALLQGPHHVVRSVRLDHRFLYTYVLDTEEGEFEVVGKGLLRKRVIETEILAESKLGWRQGSKLYAYAVTNATGEPVEGVLQILRHPVRTATNIPKGMASSYKNLREMKNLGRTHFEDDYYKEFFGLSAQKREWAARKGLDPYSMNPRVKSWLNRTGWLTLAGDMTVRLATLPVPAGAANIAMSVLGATTNLSEQLADVAPEDIRIDTRAFLEDELEVDDELAERFLEHPWYSPSHQRTIIHALSQMKGAAHRERFITLATRADDFHEAYSFTRLALMLAEYHERRSEISEIVLSNDFLMAKTEAGETVLPLYLDYAYWTASVEASERALTSSIDEAGESAAKVMIVSGQLSARAASALGERDWEVISGLEELWLRDGDQARYERARTETGRILPRIGG